MGSEQGTCADPACSPGPDAPSRHHRQLPAARTIGTRSGASSDGLGPHWVRVGTDAHGRGRAPTVAIDPEEPQLTGPPAQAAGMMHGGDSDCGPEGHGWLHRGSKRVATGVRNDREARPQTVKNHDTRSCHRRPLTWHFSRVLPGPQHHAVPCEKTRYRSRTEVVAWGWVCAGSAATVEQGTSGHQRSPTVQRNRRSLAVQLTQPG
jgi:hypothetical protein